MNKKIILIGPRTDKQNPSKTGGAVVLFEDLLRYCVEHHIPHFIIDTNKLNYPNRISAIFSVIFQLLKYLPSSSHVSYHTSRNYIYLGLPILLFSKLFGRSTSLRKFGGEVADVYQNSGFIRKKLVNLIFSQFDFLFMEMKFLVNFFQSINPNTFWFPNVRKRPDFTPVSKTYSKRFVFISQVREDKGIDEILQASNQLDESYTIDIFGPIIDEKYTPEYFKKYRAIYRRSLQAHEVVPVLNTYDVLLLPTYYKGEGYPGIIVEAYSSGLPVIATNLKGISEITDPYQTGILIDPKSPDQLVKAIEYFSTADYPAMSRNALEKFNVFDTEIQTAHFLKLLRHS